MIDFVVVSDLQPHVLDTRLKRGAELSTDHYLVVSWLRRWGEDGGKIRQTQTSREGQKELQRLPPGMIQL